MKRLVIESGFSLLYVDHLLRVRDFKTLYRRVKEQKICPISAMARDSSSDLCHAIDLACVFYFRRVMCLQRSAAATLLLRQHGWPAEMVIGAQMLPFKSHAWVEVEGRIVNDKPYMLDIYRVLERC